MSSVRAIMSREVAVRPVDLHHRELGVVVGVHRLVPEVPGDLEDLLESPDHEPFQVELGSDPEEEFLVEEVVVGGERAGVCPAVDRLEDGGLELEEPVVVEVPADEGDDPAPVPEGLPALLVHDQVHVPLAVALLDVGEPVELLRQGADRLAEEGEGVHPDGDLAQFCPEHVAGHPDDVPPLDELVEEIELLLPDIVLPDIELDLAGLVPEVGKDGLAMVADNVDPPCGRVTVSALLSWVISAYFVLISATVCCRSNEGGKMVMAFFLECTDLVEPCLVECCILGGTGHRKNTRGWDGMYRNNAILDVIIPSATASEEKEQGCPACIRNFCVF